MSILIERMGMRVCPTLISFIILLIFLAPMPFGIINLGNFAGAAVSAAVMGIFAFFGRFTEFISWLWEKPLGKAVVCAVSAGAVIAVAAVLVISGFMIKAAGNSPHGQPSTLIVLGCKVKPNGPSLMLKRRLDTAFDYLLENPEVNAVVSGGKGDDEHISEALCMKNYLVEKGISEERIIMEDKSSNTRENLKFSQKIIEEKQLNPNITIVSDGFHQLRAKMIAESVGIENTWSISAPTSLWLMPTYVVREWFGVAYQFVFG